MLEITIELPDYIIDHLIIECEKKDCTISELITEILQKYVGIVDNDKV